MLYLKKLFRQVENSQNFSICQSFFFNSPYTALNTYTIYEYTGHLFPFPSGYHNCLQMPAA